jgi:hypothetical protein
LEKKPHQILGGILKSWKNLNEIKVFPLGIRFARKVVLRLVGWGLVVDLGGGS